MAVGPVICYNYLSNCYLEVIAEHFSRHFLNSRRDSGGEEQPLVDSWQSFFHPADLLLKPQLEERVHLIQYQDLHTSNINFRCCPIWSEI